MMFFGFCGFHAKRTCFYFIAYFPHRILYAGHGFSNPITLAYIGFSGFYYSETYLRCNDPHCNNDIIMVYHIPYHLCWRPTVFLCFLAAGCPITFVLYLAPARVEEERPTRPLTPFRSYPTKVYGESNYKFKSYVIRVCVRLWRPLRSTNLSVVRFDN